MRWWLAVVATFLPVVLAYVIRLVLGGVAVGCGHVVARLRYMAMPFVYSLKRAQGFRRIHGAWVKPRPTNHRKAVRS